MAATFRYSLLPETQSHLLEQAIRERLPFLFHSLFMLYFHFTLFHQTLSHPRFLMHVSKINGMVLGELN